MAQFDLTKAFQGSASLGSQGAYIGQMLRKKYGDKATGIGGAVGAGAGFLFGGLSGGPDPNLGADAYEGAYDSIRRATMQGARQTSRAAGEQISQAFAARGLNQSGAAAGVQGATEGRILAGANQQLAPLEADLRLRAVEDKLLAQRIGEHERRQGYADTAVNLGVTLGNMAKVAEADRVEKEIKDKASLTKSAEERKSILPHNFGEMTPGEQKLYLEGMEIELPGNWETMPPNEKNMFLRMAGLKMFSNTGPYADPNYAFKGASEAGESQVPAHLRPGHKPNPLPSPIAQGGIAALEAMVAQMREKGAPDSAVVRAMMSAGTEAGKQIVSQITPPGQPAQATPQQIINWHGPGFGAPPAAPPSSADWMGEPDTAPGTPPPTPPPTRGTPGQTPEQIRQRTIPGDPSAMTPGVAPVPPQTTHIPPGSTFPSHVAPKPPPPGYTLDPNQQAPPPTNPAEQGTPTAGSGFTDSGVAMLKGHEGFRNKVYPDSKGKATIGYGRNIDDNPLTPEERTHLGLKPGEKVKSITKAQAEYLFKNDVNTAIVDAQTVLGETWKTLDPARKDVVINMLYNMGKNKVLGFKKAMAAIKSGNWEVAAKEMLDSDWREDVGNRAHQLADIMRGRKLQPGEDYMKPTPPTKSNAIAQPPLTPPQAGAGAGTGVGFPTPESVNKRYNTGFRGMLSTDEQKELEEQSKTPTTNEELTEFMTAYPKTMQTLMANPSSELAKGMMNPHTNHLIASLFAEFGDDWVAEAVQVYNTI